MAETKKAQAAKAAKTKTAEAATEDVPQGEELPQSEENLVLEQTPREVLDDDGGLPQPTQDPNVVIESDPGAEDDG